MDTPDNKEQRKKKKAVGVFPRLSISKSMELLNAIYELGEGEPVRRRTVFDKLGKSPESGPSRVLIIASNSGYGLTTGSYTAEYLGITDRGKQICSGVNSITRFQAIYEALFSNEIFSAFVARFNDRGVPIDEIATEYLKTNHELSQEDAQACWAVFKENLSEQNLTQELSGKRVIISQNAALEILGKSAEQAEKVSPKTDAAPDGEIAEQHKATIDVPKIFRQTDAVLPQIHFNIQIVIPENATPEVYDTIFKRKRSVTH